MDGTTAKPGIVPRALQYLFERAQKLMAPEDHRLFAPIYKMSMSHLEIYNEKVFDLMVKNNGNNTNSGNHGSLQDLAIRQDYEGAIHVADLTETSIKCIADFEQCYTQSRINRKTAATLLNSSSSRSHSVLTIHVR
jgi:hypothetical protein